jgi:GNAT superfamily N-acetyltransferase
MGVTLLETRRDYFTNRAHGYVAILVVAREAEGRGVGRALLKAAEDWGTANGFTKLTLAVFADNRRAKDFTSVRGGAPNSRRGTRSWVSMKEQPNLRMKLSCRGGRPMAIGTLA